jgi:hypothetical protein
VVLTAALLHVDDVKLVHTVDVIRAGLAERSVDGDADADADADRDADADAVAV